MPLAAFTDADALAQAIVARVGPRVVLALPLGLGKANHVANALYARALADRSLDLSIFTALTLEPPRLGSDLERRYLGPVVARTMGGYPPLGYAAAQRRGALPDNIRVNEFFFQAGSRLGSPSAQQNYISANYSHAGRYILGRGVNVVAQLVAARGSGADRRFSLACNTDLSLELLEARRQGRADFVAVAQTNTELPFMGGEADIPSDAFEMVLEDHDFPLFAPPREPIGAAHYAQGFHVAALIPDGGSLQLGIGSTADAVCQALIVRHRAPDVFAQTLRRLTAAEGGPPRHLRPFEVGLYGVTEMFVDGFLQLRRAGILRRMVDGVVLHAGFFLGPRDFYAALREMDEAERALFAMTRIAFTNALYGDQEAKAAARADARFVNNAMMATLLGDVVSDQLEDGRLVSGVGGQYDFVAQAFALEGARSILTVNASRLEGGKARSNIRWNYGHTTIPRHLKDLIVTEYGVADLRGRSDAETIAAMLAVTDSRFVGALEEQARAAGKLPRGASLVTRRGAATPDALDAALAPAREAGLAPPFPFGTDLDDAEQALAPAMERLREASAHPARLAGLALRGLRRSQASPDLKSALVRLGLDQPKGAAERLTAALVRGAWTD